MKMNRYVYALMLTAFMEIASVHAYVPLVRCGMGVCAYNIMVESYGG